MRQIVQNYTAPTRQHDLDHTHQKYICPEDLDNQVIRDPSEVYSILIVLTAVRTQLVHRMHNTAVPFLDICCSHPCCVLVDLAPT